MKKVFLALASCLTLTASAASPWLHKVYEFMPAPGQFVNVAPEFEEGDSYEDIIAKAEEYICGDNNSGLISLGAFGGYVVVGFDHPVVNEKGQSDFKIYGNSFKSDQSGNGGSSEPAIVMVSEDVNQNGLPDDPWYQLAGSEYNNPGTHHNVTITYYRPDDNKTPEPDKDDASIIDSTYIKFTSDDPSHPEGYVKKLMFHTQSYWPEWLKDREEITFEGITCLPDNFSLSGSGDEVYYTQYSYDFGYADNRPNDDDEGFDIDWAVDSEGNQVNLNGIHFIKIYTGINQSCGWLGETSSEITGGEDLHPDSIYIPSAIDNINAGAGTRVICSRGIASITVNSDTNALIYNAAGIQVADVGLTGGQNTVDLNKFGKGIYLIIVENKTFKVAL